MKGIDVLVRAVRALPANVPIELVVHCAGSGSEERAYEASVRTIANGDPRIAVGAPIGRAVLADTFMH